MQFKLLLVQCIKKVVIYGLVTLSSIGLYFYLSNKNSDLVIQEKRLKQDIVSLNSRLLTTNAEVKQFIKNSSLWETLPEKYKNHEGIRVDYAKDIVDSLEQRYRLSNMQMTLSKPKDLKQDQKLKEFSLFTTSLNFSFSAMSDYHAFAFINALTQLLPGYTSFESFSITRNDNITDESLAKIKQGNFPKLVSINMVVNWYNLKMPENETSNQVKGS